MCTQHDEISRDALVGVDANEVPHLDVLRSHQLSGSVGKQALVAFLVDRNVRAPALHVIGFLSHGDGQDKDQRCNVTETQQCGGDTNVSNACQEM